MYSHIHGDFSKEKPLLFFILRMNEKKSPISSAVCHMNKNTVITRLNILNIKYI